MDRKPAGEGIFSGLFVRCTKRLQFKFNLWAGTATWKQPAEEETVVECAELWGGEVKSGIVKIIQKSSK